MWAEPLEAFPLDPKILIIGETGTGKSHFASTAPSPLYLFNFDDTIDNYRQTQCWVDEALFDPSIPIAQRWNSMMARAQEFLSDPKEFKTFIIDSTTTLTAMAIEFTMALDGSRGLGNAPIPKIHNLAARNLIESFLALVVKIPRTIIVIAHPEKTKDDVTGAVMVGPAVPGKLTNGLPRLFGEVYSSHATVTDKGMAYQLRTCPDGLYHARSRLKNSFPGIKPLMPNTWDAFITTAMATVLPPKPTGEDQDVS